MVDMNTELKQPFALINGRVILADRIAEGLAVVMSHGKIESLVPMQQLSAGIAQVDAAGRWITPGLIDGHTHGALGHTFNEPTEEAFSTILAENLGGGVTGLVATVGAAPFAEMKEIFSFARQWMADPHSGGP